MTASVDKIWLHRFVILLMCCGVFLILLQSTGWLIRTGELHLRMSQREVFAQSEAQLMSRLLSPLLQTQNPDSVYISQFLRELTDNRYILDASVYSDTGVLIASTGDNVPLPDRLGISGNDLASQSTRQLVQTIAGHTDPAGFLRLTLTTLPDSQSSQLLTHLISLIQAFLFISLMLGVVLARVLRRPAKPSH